MSSILKELEDSILEKVYIDVEVNSLEDAYINIAREEEKLQNGKILPESQDDGKFKLDLQTYMDMESNPSTCQQIKANFLRRLIQYKKQPTQIVININMVFYILIQIFII